LKRMKLGQSIVLGIKPTDLNPILPASKAVRESTLMNTRLDTMWTYLSQLGLPVEAFIFSQASDGETRTAAKIILDKDYCVEIHVSYQEPLQMFSGKTDAKYKLMKGKQLLAEGQYITELKDALKKLPICQKGIVTQNGTTIYE